MSDGFSPYKTICTCGHDKATHYRDENGPGCCLGMRCDCVRYVDHLAPPEPKTVRPPPPPPDLSMRIGARVRVSDPASHYYGFVGTVEKITTIAPSTYAAVDFKDEWGPIWLREEQLEVLP